MKNSFSTLLCCLALANLSHGKFFTSLDIDNHPCKPENLKVSNRYICDSLGNVICQSGWKEPDVQTELSELNPCLEPVCGTGCVHGECTAPNHCACEVGWEGNDCNTCVALPGCLHGSCQSAFECNCESGWEGAMCDYPKCDSCVNGYCSGPNTCVCNEGWTGENCTDCQTMPGCVHGHCVDHPNTCVCEMGWTGHLCDQPACNPPCIHGQCTAGTNGTNYCVCSQGWKGPSCDQCVPYWECPNQSADACHLPNECYCFSGETDPNKLCNHTALISPQGATTTVSVIATSINANATTG